MNQKSYHHGNLKQSLIEAGITIISEQGEQALSLRKVATLCGVSHSAPYAHFQNKQDLLSTMKEYVTQKFVDVLQETLQTNPYDQNLLSQMGKAYVMFFVRNPHYFSFLFSQLDIPVNLNLDANLEDNYPPFVLFQKTALCVLEKNHYPKENCNNTIIAMWALVHGLASIATMKNIQYQGIWEDSIEAIIKSFSKGII